MNEQEKEAIKDTKDILKELNKHKDKDFIGRLYYKNKPIEDILQIFLNLIEKQQKEIEKLKDELKEERNFNKSALETLKECVHKDKIKEKIDLIDKEYAEIIEKNKNDLYLVNINAQRHSAMQTILEELLGGKNYD